MIYLHGFCLPGKLERESLIKYYVENECEKI